MREKILALLIAKFAGVPNAILERIATKKAETTTTEEQATTLVEGLTLQNVFDSYGDSRATEASQTATSNYEKKYGIKDGKPVGGGDPNPNPKPTGGSNEPKALTAEDVQKIIADALKPIADTVTQREQQTKAEQRTVQVLAKAKEYGIPETQAKRYSIPEDADLDTYFKDVKQELKNEGFEGVRTPEAGDQQMEKESDAIAKMINDGTKTIVEQNKI